MKKIVACAVVSIALFHAAYAAETPITVSGTLSVTVPLSIEKNKSSRLLQSQSAPKTIVLNKIILSRAAQNYLAKSVTQISSKTLSLQTIAADKKKLPTQIDLGMNQVPVLDQGRHGSCVTFANTAAIDAAIAQGDYISQLCNLSLGKYLHDKDPGYPSGWDGSSGNLVLRQIKRYGIITKNYQKNSGCGGVYDYPLDDQNNTGRAVSPFEFARHGEDIMQKVTSKSLLNYDDALSAKTSATQLLADIKNSLAEGHRVTFGVLLDANDGTVGAYGSYKMPNDSWIITPKIINDAKAHAIDAGHEMIIIAYDDNAVITGANNVREKGVFTLRNSWSSRAGNQGNYYMSYRYFTTFAVEAYQISAPRDGVM